MKLLITGGTLDKDYDSITGNLTFSKTHLNEILQQANSTQKITLETLMLKDSLDISDKDREIITQACINTSESKIVIIHGTDTMVKTAKQLNNQPALKHKTIILTGAMRPYKLGNSDALFNLGAAISACTILGGGVKIAMNGNIFEADKVIKDTELGVFISQNK